MNPMAIGANRRFLVSSCERLLMNAVQRGVILIWVALLTRGVEIKGEVPASFCGDRIVRKSRDVFMTLHTGIPQPPMCVGSIYDRIYGEVKRFSGGKLRLESRCVMAGETGIIVNALGNRSWMC